MFMVKDMSSLFKYIKVLSGDINKNSKKINIFSQTYENITIFNLTDYEIRRLNIGGIVATTNLIEKDAKRMRVFVNSIMKSLK